MTAVGAWTGPALVLGVASLVFAGSPVAPAVALAAVVGPLLGVLSPAGGPRVTSGLAGAAEIVAAGGVLAATLLVAGDLGVARGMGRWGTVAPLLGLACALALVRRLCPLRALVLPVGVVLLAAPLAAAVAATGVSPWGAWASLVDQPAARFPAQGGWASEGRTVLRRTTLTFDEEQRVTAVGGGVFRLAERDGADRVVREWRLRAGEALSVRAGDELTIPAGTRMRFEAGRRVPGTPPSGVAWAEPRARLTARAALEGLGAVLTVAGGAAALGAAPAAGRLLTLATGATLAVVLSVATAWGVYAAWLGPDIALGASPLAALLETPALASGAARGEAVQGLAVAGLVLLGVAQALALHARLVELTETWWSRLRGGEAPSRAADAVWLAVAGAAAAVALVSLDPWRVLLGALALAVSGALAPVLGGGARGAPAGAVAGVLGVTALTAAPLVVPAAAGAALALYPALGAAPLAWLVARLVAGARGLAPAPRPRRAAASCRSGATLPQ